MPAVFQRLGKLCVLIEFMICPAAFFILPADRQSYFCASRFFTERFYRVLFSRLHFNTLKYTALFHVLDENCKIIIEACIFSIELPDFAFTSFCIPVSPAGGIDSKTSLRQSVRCFGWLLINLSVPDEIVFLCVKKTSCGEQEQCKLCFDFDYPSF